MPGMTPPAPGPGGYGYPQPPQPGFGFPPQPMMPMPMAPGGGMPMLVGPPFGMPGMGAPAPPSEKKVAGKQVATVHPPGMPRAFDVPFAERRLPVCDRCKKNFKSRELCRRRDGHKALPWQTTYVVITLTDDVVVKADDGTMTHADIPVIAELQDTPLMCLGPADGSMEFEPICKVCREKNYTRDYCRKTCKHTTPPWSTTYVKLVVDKTPKDDHKLKLSKRRKKQQEENADGKPIPDENDPSPEEESNDDLTQIHQSKTFLAVISSRKITVRWCERIQYPTPSEQEESAESSIQQPAASNNPNMQYQLWDAFRAGAMWAQSQGGQVPPGYGYGGMPNAPPGGNMGFFGQPPAGAPMGGGYPGGQPPQPNNVKPEGGGEGGSNTGETTNV